MQHRHVAETVASRHQIEVGIRKRKRHHVTDEKRAPRLASGLFRSGKLHHPVGDVESHDRRTACRQREGDVPGTAGEVEGVNPAGAASDLERFVDEVSLPAPIAAVRQRHRDEVVSVSDGREELTNVAALRVGSVECAAQPSHKPPLTRDTSGVVP